MTTPVKFKHPRLRSQPLSLADGVVEIDQDGIFLASSPAQIEKAERMSFERLGKKRGRPKKTTEG